MPPPSRLLSLLCSLLLVPTIVAAAMTDELSLRYSASSGRSLSLGAQAVGEVSVQSTNFEWRTSSAPTAGRSLGIGFSWQAYDLAHDAGVVLPDRLHAVALPLNLRLPLSHDWNLFAALQPGFYGDLEHAVSLAAFNSPALLLARRAQTPNFAWSLGLRLDALADQAVLPLAGVEWKFAPQWEFNLGLPRTGVTWRVDPALRWHAGVSLQGGSFHLDANPQPNGTTRQLGDTRLAYREIRLGLAVDYSLTPALTLTAEAGTVLSQRFDYHQQDYLLKGDGGGYCTVGVRGRF